MAWEAIQETPVSRPAKPETSARAIGFLTGRRLLSERERQLGYFFGIGMCGLYTRKYEGRQEKNLVSSRSVGVTTEVQQGAHSAARAGKHSM
jgi:hypothetical protein